MKIPFLPYYIGKQQVKKEVQQGIVTGFGVRYGSKIITPSFANMIDFYLSDPMCKGGIDELSETSVGHGGYFSAKNKDVLAYADDYAEEIDLDGLHQTWARELWATGNAITEKVDPDNIRNLVRLPISSFTHIKADKFGKITELKQKIDNDEKTWNSGELNRLIHFAWNPIDASLTGRGLLEPLLRQGLGYTWTGADNVEHDEKRPTFASIIEETEDSMRKVLIRYTPKFVYVFKGFGDDEINAATNKLKVLRPDDDVALNTTGQMGRQDITVTRLATDPRSRLDPFVEYFFNQKVMALETPSVKLFLEAGFTEASAQSAIQMVDRKVDAFRRFQKRKDERDVFKPLIIQNMKELADKKKWKEAELRWNWNPIETPIVLAQDIVSAVQEAILSREEARKYFEKAGIELIAILAEKPAPVPAPSPTPNPNNPNNQNQNPKGDQK